MAAEHLVVAGIAVVDADRGMIGIIGVLGGVVVLGDGFEASSLRQGDGAGEVVLPLPVEIPVLDPEERLDLAIGEGGDEADLTQSGNGRGGGSNRRGHRPGSLRSGRPDDASSRGGC